MQVQDEVLSEQDFECEADRALRALERAIDALDGLEADLQSGILTLEFPDGAKYIVNSHRAARQIWMAAERSAWHFDYAKREDRWVAGKSGEALMPTLEALLSRKLGRAVTLG
jgi:CyaY protein